MFRQAISIASRRANDKFCHRQRSLISNKNRFYFGTAYNDRSGAHLLSDPNNDESNGESPTSSTTDDDSTSVLTPTKIGFGDEAPCHPHLTAIPVVSRPLFPGIISSINLTDPATITALEKISNGKKGGTGTGGYVGVFLRNKNSNGVSEGGVLIESPEIITDPKDIYSVGTFAQIQRFTRENVGGGKGHSNPSNLHSQFGSNDEFGIEDTLGGSDGSTVGEESVSASVLLLAHRRVDLVSVDNIGPPIDVTVEHWERMQYNAGKDSNAGDDTIRALTNEILSTIREVATLNPLFREHVTFSPTRIDANDPYRLADFAASLTTGSPEELQAVLEERDAEMRLHKALVLLTKEREVSKLQQEISRKVEEKMSETQRKYMLMEQLKSIKKELGMEQDDKEALVTKYRKKLAEYNEIPEEVMEIIESELEKMSTLDKNSAEFNVTRSYLDWLTNVPWGVTTKENFDIKDARRCLDRDHYGLDEVKDTILEFIAVGKLKGTVQGKILCLSGPPGCGKTSIAKSVADALGRKFYRFSVGGLSDVSEIKGHRRTYIGAMPGKLIQCLKSTGTTNPLVLIDEIDKLGHGHRGDPAAALLEVLDPSQNDTFRDHFLDVPVDISKVLFMCTANDMEYIPGPLRDRMEIIRLSGYDVPEKIAIAEQFLLPKALRDCGLTKEDEEGVEKVMNDITLQDKVPASLEIDRSAIEHLVRWYCREAGVRNLNKHIEKVIRKLALQIVAEEEGAELTEKSTRKSNTWVVSKDNLEEYVGKAIFTSDRLYDKDPLPHGIVMGLAWTSMGGCALYIETQVIKRGVDSEGKPKGGGMLKVTGQLGNVMEESSQIAYTVARARLDSDLASSSYFDNVDIHMHVPEGATPKDGPSAGVTMTTAMLSLALGKPVKNDLAMTGEISLTGKVLPVGGIKEKTMAARRAGIKCIVFPAGNRRDFDEMPEYLKEGLEVHFADDYSTVYEVAFGPK